MREVAIFRHQLFKVSEPFIVQQAEQLRRFRPFYIGRDRFAPQPQGALSLALEDLRSQKFYFIQRLWQVITRDSKPYQDLLHNRRPVLVHAHFGVEGIYALQLARRLKIPLVTTFHGFDATITTSSLFWSGKPAWINYALFKRRLAIHGDLFICVSEHIRKRVLLAGFPENRVVLHYIGIDTDSIRPLNKQESGDRIILHTARLVEKKGTRYLIKAFAQIAKGLPDTKLLILGDGPMRKNLESLVDEYRLNNQIRFMGSLPNCKILDLLASADVFCLPSITAKTGDQEGLPISILEASAMAVPTVATYSGGIPEAIRDGKTGFLVPERDSNTLAERLNRLLTNRSLRYEMGQSARQLAVEKFNLRHQTGSLEKLYESVL